MLRLGAMLAVLFVSGRARLDAHASTRCAAWLQLRGRAAGQGALARYPATPPEDGRRGLQPERS